MLRPSAFFSVLTLIASICGFGISRADAATTITDATWASPVDSDGDGFVRSATLTWNDSNPGSATVQEDLYFRVTGTVTWIFLGSTSPHFISGATNTVTQPITGGSHNSYDWAIRVYPTTTFLVESTRDSTNDTDLSGYKMEQASEDVFAPVITSALTGSAKVGTSFTYQITATNSPTSFSINVVGRTTPPIGLSVDPTTGIISGIPQEFSQLPVLLTATNGGGSGTATLVLDIHYPVSGAVGLPFFFYFYPVDTTTTAGPVTSTELPAGLTLSNLDPTYAQTLVGRQTASAISGLPMAAGATSVTVTANYPGHTIVATIDITINPAPPASTLITGITISRDPVRTNTAVTFSAVSQQLQSGAEVVFIFYKDNIPLPDAVQVPTTFGSGSVSRMFTDPGNYTAFAAVFDTFSVGFFTQNFTVEALDPASTIQSVASGVVMNPDNGLGISIPSSLGGVVDVDIVDSGTSADTASRDDIVNELGGRSAVIGTDVAKNRRNFAAKFVQSGIYLITTTTGGRKARRMVPVGSPELGQPLSLPATRDDAELFPGRSSLSGKFNFTPGKADQVKLSGSILLPDGTDVSSTSVDVGVGNVIESVPLKKGNGTSADHTTKLQLKTSKKAGTPAKFTLTLTSPQLDSLGFDTEGISAKPKASLSIQLAFVINGTPFFKMVPVKAKVTGSVKKQTVQITGN